jgi:hypothetical protein
MVWRLWLGIGFGLGTDFQVIRVGERVTVRGQIARAKAAAIREFVRRDLDQGGAFALAGTFGPGRSLRLRWAGEISGFAKQRARNFLVELLH